MIAGLDGLEEFDDIGMDRVFVGYVKKWELAGKRGFLDMLMKHLGGYRGDNKQASAPGARSARRSRPAHWIPHPVRTAHPTAPAHCQPLTVRIARRPVRASFLAVAACHRA